MLDGRPLIDVHLHPAPLGSLKVDWATWVQGRDAPELRALYREDGTVDAVRLDDLLAAEGVDAAVALAEYSPRVTGIQSAEDMAALVGPRVRFAANINPHLHHPVEDELARQLDLGAVALKVHPVHGGFAVNHRALYPAYAMLQERGLPLVVHCGTSTFPGALNQYGDPIAIDDLLRDFRRLDIVLAHGGRGWWYDAAAFLVLSNSHVWIELSGLPPSRLQTYYARHNWPRLTQKMIFGTDWPGVPGIAANARAVAALCPDDQTADLVLAGNAQHVYGIGGND
ncbi:amidohydrolase family protein [uncultured Jatrophihabitans sp.]|uniref:amidohydrolase family protein n=1 Tax=uncultured Jatrophihabitans sp. TaxID=1610747 RepID=UPI0035CBFC19